jgi:hypothetical protein
MPLSGQRRLCWLRSEVESYLLRLNSEANPQSEPPPQRLPAASAPQHPVPRPDVTNQVTEEMKKDGWVSIFDGKSLSGWKDNEPGGSGSFEVQDDNIVAFGGRNHLFYTREQFKKILNY